MLAHDVLPQPPEKRIRDPVPILFIGDIFGKAGRQAVKRYLSPLKKNYSLAVVVANVENASGGIGITPGVAQDMFAVGIDVLTSGNHVWRYKEVQPMLDGSAHFLRPANYPKGAPGRGFTILVMNSGIRVGVFNLQGRVFMSALDCPFRTADALLEQVVLGRDVDILLVDFHAEATSEKMAMAYHLDGRVSAVLGTHTHVPTADHRILPGGTGFVSDVGMTGCYDSVIGMTVASVMPTFLLGLPQRFQPEEKAGTLCGVVTTMDPNTGVCVQIEPVRLGGTLQVTHSGYDN